MKIPKRFKQFGATIEVEDNPRLGHERNWNGCASYQEHRIELMPITDTAPQSVAKREQTFCHEVVHHLLYGGGGAIDCKLDSPAHQNEDLVECLGNLLHQFLTTAEYSDVKTPRKPDTGAR